MTSTVNINNIIVPQIDYEQEVRKAFKPIEKVFKTEEGKVIGFHVQVEDEEFSEYANNFPKSVNVKESTLRTKVYRTIYLHKIKNQI